MNKPVRRIPAWIGNVLLIGGLASAFACYFWAGAITRGEPACDTLASASDDLVAQCLAEAGFWHSVAISGFMICLVVTAIGLVLDRLQRWIRW